MRGILIDSAAQAVAEIEWSGEYEDMLKILECEAIAEGAYLGGSIEHGFDAVMVSDDYLEDRDNPRFWFQVDANRDPPSSYPIAGRGLAVGTDPEGKSCDVCVRTEDLVHRVTFTQRKFRGFDVRKPREGVLVVDVVAPIIDGPGQGRKA